MSLTEWGITIASTGIVVLGSGELWRGLKRLRVKK